MAYEVLNNGPVTPARLHALLRLIPRLVAPQRQDLYDLLQPASLRALRSTSKEGTSDQSTSKDVMAAALALDLVEENAEKVVRLKVNRRTIDAPEHFRAAMQRTMCGVTDAGQPNYLLNEYVAWYAVQDAGVFRFERLDFETRFNDDLYPSRPERPFNTTKLSGWRTWAAYLGWGWLLPFGGSELLAPDAHDRLQPLLPRLLGAQGRVIPFAAFMESLAEVCPELDGGSLFERCWEAGRGGEERGRRLSLMLSTGLRGLHDEGALTLVRQGDGGVWRLFHAEGHLINEVTHIGLGRR